MDFRLEEQQLALRETVRRFCTTRFPTERIAQRDGQRLDHGAWREMAELGVFALLVPEGDGGLGLGVVEGAIGVEQAEPDGDPIVVENAGEIENVFGDSDAHALAIGASIEETLA